MEWAYLLITFAFLGLFLRERRQSDGLERELQQLQAKRQAMRRVLDHMDEGAMLLSLNHQVLYANPAALHMLGSSLHALPQPVAVEEFIQNPTLLEAIHSQEGTTLRQVLRIQTNKGGTLALEVTLAPAGPSGILLVLRDTRKLEDVERKRRDFVTNASHELKTPIAAMIGLLDLVDIVDEERVPDLLDRARRNASSLSEMVEDLLGLARAEDPDWKLAPELCDLRETVDRVYESLEDRAMQKNLSLETDAGLEPFMLTVDQTCFETVLRNLATNAVNYCRRGKIWIRLRREAGVGAVLEVEDTGPGIDPEIVPRIFERFFRGDPAHSKATGGTGLGLSIVRNLVNRMGGRIAVESVPGEGSLFRVELPENPSNPLPGATSAMS
ncbi:MAG: PAS domain-containing protein [Planctomycetes bacterium]|nr:PAS domain-containing protein [Planctomycetota bacterium]